MLYVYVDEDVVDEDGTFSAGTGWVVANRGRYTQWNYDSRSGMGFIYLDNRSHIEQFGFRPASKAEQAEFVLLGGRLQVRRRPHGEFRSHEAREADEE